MIESETHPSLRAGHPARCLLLMSCSSAILAIACVTSADEAHPSPKITPPKFELLAASTMTAGETEILSLTLKVTNTNDVPLKYHGYRREYLGPPLKPDEISPVMQIEFEREKQRKPFPLGHCGFGLATLELKPKSSSTFEVIVPADQWEAVNVGIGHFAGWPGKQEATSATIWSVEIQRDEIEKLLKPVSAEKPAK